MDINKNVGKNIKRIRNERKLTQEELANKVGAIKQTISKIERGVFSPSFSLLVKICNELYTSPNELLLEDSQRLQWVAENPDQLEYSIKGLEQEMTIVEDLWAKSEKYKEDGEEQQEAKVLHEIISHFAWENDHFREVAEYLYKKRLNDYLAKTSQELRNNKVMNLRLMEKKAFWKEDKQE
ncbi:helix-turn-helix domain-containing protein [Oceanobacillus sojae]|uniref:helix-turn-helix domain-containing protein n=1 Tax=Oceanobacillus sojae TaxID=582851 RepID=UPI0021A57511|nr:helix-turn-helix transcriptional regulator [Oceanobacillus sojae]MCT1904439.1 helix-turn-helix domain-containing protein [Oceanobacillus sojae]